MRLLEGVKVLDFGRLVPAPLSASLLGDLGAEVIKIEDMEVGDYYRTAALNEWRGPYLGGYSPHYLVFNRNKRGMVVDFRRSKEGLELIYDLVRQSDVVIEGSRVGNADKIGIGYEQLRAINPRIIYCAITGFGQYGKLSALGAHGGNADAVVGMNPPRQLEDGSSASTRTPGPSSSILGAWAGAMAVCAALVRRHTTGEGCFIDISCSDAFMQTLSRTGVGPLNGEVAPPQTLAFKEKYNNYQTKDGKYVTFAAAEQHFWNNFCDAIDRPNLKERGDWSAGMDLGTDQDLRQELTEIFKSKTQDEWVDLYLKHNIVGGPIYDIKEAVASEHFLERKMLEEFEHPVYGTFKQFGSAFKIQGDPYELKYPPPMRAEHTDDVLRFYGLTEERIKELHESGAVE